MIGRYAESMKQIQGLQSLLSTEIYPAQMEKVDNLKKELCQKGLEVKMSCHL